MNKFWISVLSSKDPTSAKRIVTLIMAGHFIITSFLVSFFVFYLIIYTPRGSVNKDLLNLLASIIEQDFYIILAGLGIIGVENVANIMLEKAKATVAGNIAVGSPSTDTIKVDNPEPSIKDEPK